MPGGVAGVQPIMAAPYADLELVPVWCRFCDGCTRPMLAMPAGGIQRLLSARVLCWSTIEVES